MPGTSSSTAEGIKGLIRMEKERRKTIREAHAWDLLKTVARSPIAQMVGTVAVAEVLENEGILSGRWAGALEGGVIAMVGLQALKDYGVLGAAGLGLGIGTGSIIGEFIGNTPSDAFAKGGTTGLGIQNALKLLGIGD
jgi:hypothetical protein